MKEQKRSGQHLLSCDDIHNVHLLHRIALLPDWHVCSSRLPVCSGARMQAQLSTCCCLGLASQMRTFAGPPDVCNLALCTSSMVRGSPLTVAGIWRCRQQLVGKTPAQFPMLLQQTSSASSNPSAGAQHNHHAAAADG